jgi:hypothetical protein
MLETLVGSFELPIVHVDGWQLSVVVLTYHLYWFCQNSHEDLYTLEVHWGQALFYFHFDIFIYENKVAREKMQLDRQFFPCPAAVEFLVNRLNVHFTQYSSLLSFFFIIVYYKQQNIG